VYDRAEDKRGALSNFEIIVAKVTSNNIESLLMTGLASRVMTDE
jgi:hypothetical protein